MQVTEMVAEYYAPKEDIILQNEYPSDLHLLVTGEVVCRILWIYHVILNSQTLQGLHITTNQSASSLTGYCGVPRWDRAGTVPGFMT